jgi:hypothetical protein
MKSQKGSTLSLTYMFDWVSGQPHIPAVLPPGKNQYQLYSRLGGPKCRSGRVQKISPPPEFNPRTVQPIASRYADWAIRLKVKYVFYKVEIIVNNSHKHN